jgi:antitoxin component YwqK of YwqJK toxin-antitoxin module
MAENWYVVQNGRRHGPYTGAELKRQAATGHLLPIDLVVKDGMEKPVPAAKVKGLFDSQPATKPPVQPSPITAHEAPRPAPRRPAPEPDRKKMYLLLGGGGLLAVAVVIVVIVLASGRKPSTANNTDVAKSDGGNKTPSARAEDGGRTSSPADAKIELPDFTKVDYSFDTSKLDYSKGSRGQSLVRSKGIAKNSARGDVLTEWQGYKDERGEMVQHGLNTIFHSAEKKAEESFYFAGKQHGAMTTWYTTGEKESSGQMKDGSKHGKWQCWHENGKLKQEVYWLNGQEHGTDATWFEGGQKQYERTFVKGEMQGPDLAWWPNGNKGSELTYKSGVPHGPATWWDEKGKILFRLQFRDGKTHYDPASGTAEDFADVVAMLRKLRVRRGGLEGFFETFGKPVSGYIPVPDMTRANIQWWVYRCSDGEAKVHCAVNRDDHIKFHEVSILSVTKR